MRSFPSSPSSVSLPLEDHSYVVAAAAVDGHVAVGVAPAGEVHHVVAAARVDDFDRRQPRPGCWARLGLSSSRMASRGWCPAAYRSPSPPLKMSLLMRLRVDADRLAGPGVPGLPSWRRLEPLAPPRIAVELEGVVAGAAHQHVHATRPFEHIIAAPAH